jgi:hypothetical protein
MKQPTRKKSFLTRLLRIVLKTVLFLLLFLELIVLLILTPPVQNFIRKKAVTYLENKLHTKVAVGRIYIGLPKKVVIEDIYVEDRQKDTLLSAGSLKVNIALLKLFKGEVEINEVELKNSTVKIKRQLPDTAFNFQFIIDAFSSPKTTKKESTNSSSGDIAIHNVKLDKIRLVYKDVLTGNDVEAWLNHFDTKIDKIDPAHLAFDIPETNIDGLAAKFYQVKPLAAPEPVIKDTVKTSPTLPLQLGLGTISLKNIQLDYGNDVSLLYSKVNIGKTTIKVNRFDIDQQIIDLKDVSLSNINASLRIGKKEATRKVIKKTGEKIQTEVKNGWRILAGSVKLDNDKLRFDDDNSPAQKTGMDYAHLNIDSLTLHAKGFILANDSIAGNITEARLKERKGFILQKLTTRFLYANNQAWLKDLYLETPGTELKKNIAIQYASINALKEDIGNMYLDANIENSKVLVKDILTFVPSLQTQPAFADPSATWYINSYMKGRVSNLQIAALQIQGLQDTKIDISGNLAGLPDFKNIMADLTIRDISSSKRDIDLFVPPAVLPKNITLPGRLHISGKANGNAAAMKTDIAIQTDLGNASVKGKFQQLNDLKKIKYDASVQTVSLDIGTILQQKETFGTVTATFTAIGTGTDPKTANALLNGNIQSAVIKQYTYHDLAMKGSIANQQVKINAGIIDPNIHFAINAEADLSKEYPAVVMNAMIDSIKMQPLHLTPDVFIYRGKIEGNFPVTDPSNLQGHLFITQSVLVSGGQRVQLDTVKLLAGSNDSGHYVLLNSAIANVVLTGQYELTALGNIFQEAIEPYFSMKNTAHSQSSAPYDFRLIGGINNGPALKAILPGLDRLEPVNFQSHFTSKEGWSAHLTAPAIDINNNRIRNLQLQVNTRQDQLLVKTSLGQYRNDGSIELDNTSFTASLSNNTIDFALNIKDRSLKNKYNLEGSLQQPQPGNYAISLKPGNLLLNYDSWNISQANKIIISGKKINATDLLLSKSGQELKISSQSQSADGPMEIDFNNFKLVTLTGFVQTDSTLADGTLNGKLTLIDLTSNPVFTGDLTINNLRLRKDTVGDVHLLVNNKVSNAYNADITISGRGNDIRLAGNYYPASASNNFDFNLDIRQMPLTIGQAFSGGAIHNASGSVNGKFAVKGTMERPEVSGSLNFNKVSFIFGPLNSYFAIDQDKIELNSTGIRFNDFAVKDSAGNQLIINGTAATTNFMHYQFDMKVRANNFHALNSTKKENKLFYGQLYFNTNITVTGTDKLPVIDGQLTVNEKTKMTIVLPQREPGVVDREGIVEFVDKDAPLNDSLFLGAIDSLNQSPFTGMNVSMTIQVNKQADLTLIIDEGNGDFLNVKGEAELTADVDRSGKIILAGTYELESGAYELSFNLLHRKFLIEKGSKITWGGEPTKADVDITAKYIANVSPLDLVKSELSENLTNAQLNTYLQKLPFDVVLKMEGKLLQPKITFDIILPDNKSYVVSNDIIANVRTKLDELRQEEGEMNKQVFSLLLLNRFVAENPFDIGSGTSASTLARQSVSKLMTEQLNRLAGELVKGVDLNFDVQASEDYTTGERRDRTDLNVGLSKQLLDDRLTVTVGSNFELEGPQTSQQSTNIAGNVALDYKLSKDGRYLLRAYRKNEYQGIIDGYVIETGVGFIITLDYNRFREIFQGRKKKQKRKDKEPATSTATEVEPLKKEEE